MGKGANMGTQGWENGAETKAAASPGPQLPHLIRIFPTPAQSGAQALHVAQSSWILALDMVLQNDLWAQSPISQTSKAAALLCRGLWHCRPFQHPAQGII